MSLSLPTYFRSVPDKVWFMYLMQMKGESERLNCQVTPPSAKGFKKWANASASLMRSLMPHSSTTATIRRRCRGDRWAKTSAKASRSSTAEKRAEGTSCRRSLWESRSVSSVSSWQGKKSHHQETRHPHSARTTPVDSLKLSGKVQRFGQLNSTIWTKARDSRCNARTCAGEGPTVETTTFLPLMASRFSRLKAHVNVTV